MSGRDEVLRHVRAALKDVPPGESPDDVTVARAYRRSGAAPAAETLRLFVERVEDYGATVRRVGPNAIGEATTEACRARQVRNLVVAPGTPDSWFPDGVDIVVDANLPLATLDVCGGVLTGCTVAIAQTGSVALSGDPAEGRRAITLVPDYHLCVVFTDQVVALVPEAMERLDAPVHEGRPIVFISGPSATSDIELNRVEGVHGPRTLEVLLVDAAVRVPE